MRQRLVRAALPLLVAEICFSLMCMGVGLWLWRDIDQRLDQAHQRSLLQTQQQQARLIEQRLIDQQRHLRQLGRSVRRALNTVVAPGNVITPVQVDVPYHLAPGDTMVLFGEALKPEEKNLATLLPKLYLLEPLLDDLYQSDTLIKRLAVRLPQGLVAMVPASAAPADIGELSLSLPQLTPSGDNNNSALHWHVMNQASSDDILLDAHYDLTDVQGETLACLWLELDSRHFARLIQEYVGYGVQTWLIDDQGQGLLGSVPVDLPDGAGRRGVITLTDERLPENKRAPAQLVWTVLSTNGWRLVSLQHSSPAVGAKGYGFLWLGIAWFLGSLLLLGALYVVLNRMTRNWEQALQTPVESVVGLRQWVESWKAAQWQAQPAAPRPTIMPRTTTLEATDGLQAELVRELGRLESSLEALKRQPQLLDMLEALELPAALTVDDMLIAANPAFEKLIGHSQRELQGLHESLFAIESKEGGDRVRVKGGDDNWRIMHRYKSDDEYGNTLMLLVDETESRHQVRQLSLACELARQESRLKSHYLTLLQRELKLLSEELGKRTEPDIGLHEQGSKMVELLDKLNENGDVDMPDRVQRDSLGLALQETRSVRILIVDDGPVNSMLARDVLSRHGLAVDMAGGGKEALALAQRHFYDLVFMDIFMPVPDGIETSIRWREEESLSQDARRSVLIALTANASERDRERFFAAGMDDYVAKPYRPQTLIDMIRRWLPDVDIA
ncbi:response regulator [Halomonas sp. M20]|uniref:response regulator n=1 Tax=Halomonas sp. M20 TaxID=2763264 RepID=UPI001D0A1A79|nr:response regulator [Halomonas sp. M20]